MTRCLEAEQRPGRVTPDADCPMLALALTGTVHHLLMHQGPQPQGSAPLIRRLVTALVPAPPGSAAAP